MCFTSTGTALSLPPKKKDIYRPYSLDDRPPRPSYELRIPAEEDLHAAHAILDLSASTAFLPPPAPHQLLAQQQPPSPSVQQSTPAPVVLVVPPKPAIAEPDRRPLQAHPQQQPQQQQQLHQTASPSPLPLQSPPATTVPHALGSPEQNENRNSTNTLPGYAAHDATSMDSSSDELGQSAESSDSEGRNGSKTVAYTYEAFFVSDGRSKKKMADPKTALENKAKYTCTECGKQYATSSNL
uniref:C2H2-type domain-containing protein n=1 Tax=Anopheles melas TaxID=34690 RepID=A0A182TRM8_9DIPT